jgi:hypothetical protein
MIYVIAHIQDNSSGSLLRFLKFLSAFHQTHPILTAVIGISVSLSTKRLTRRIAEFPAVIFLQIFSVLLFQDKCWSTVTPTVLHS